MKFSKLVATGNDFIFFDAQDASVAAIQVADRPDLVRRVCDRHFGVGADGVVFVEKTASGADYRWDFYNNDGSSAEMCGNATRCMGRWAQLKLGAAEIRFQTIAGLVSARVDGDMIASELSFVRASLIPLRFSTSKGEREAQLVNTGVPHAVVDIADIAEAKEHTHEIKALRFHRETGPRGANVTFLQTHGPDEFSTVTFERGVEDFTISCGTGVLAAAAVGLWRSGKRRAQVKTPGGRLEVFYGENLVGVVLKGPATLVCEGELAKEVLR